MHGVIEIRPPPVVVGAQVQREPEMLRHVVEERRREVAGDERNASAKARTCEASPYAACCKSYVWFTVLCMR